MRQSMKQFYIRFVAMAVALLLLLPAIPVAWAVSGGCGDGVTWNLEGGVLTISGSGDMKHYAPNNSAPWQHYADQIRAIRVDQGVTSVGSYAFYGLDKVTTVTLAPSVIQIGKSAFFGCSAMTMLDLGGVQIIGNSAFEMCSGLMTVRLPNTLQSIGNKAFYCCENLLSITVPSSVSYMGIETFAYCTSLCSATVLASIEKLPLWTFFDCSNLSEVALSSSITAVGESAFENCDKLSEKHEVLDLPQNVDVTSSSTTQQNGQTVVTDNHYTEREDSSVNVQTTTQSGSGSKTETSVTVDAVLDNPNGWNHLEDQVDDAVFSAAGETVEVNVHLKGEADVTGQDLGRFAGQNVTVTIHTQQGAHWHFNGKDIQADNLKESYDLSFKLVPLTDPNEEQKAVVGIGSSFVLTFDADIDFKVELELPLGISLARETAVFFSPEEEGYTRMQAVVIDAEGIAHFYLGSVQADTEYLIGINIPDIESQSNVSDAIIPDTLKNEYPEMEQIDEIEYVVTGVKSSWGMDIKQVTWILIGVMGGSILVVGIVIAVMNKMRLKKGYMPELTEEEIAEIRASARKKK